MTLISQLTSPRQEIFEFVRDYYSGFVSDDDILNIIDKHLQFGTIDLVKRNGTPIACVRWNVSPSGRVCDVLDLLISPKENGMRIMKHIIARNWSRFPTVKYIRFSRVRKYKNREPRLYSIIKFLHIHSKEKRYGR